MPIAKDNQSMVSPSIRVDITEKAEGGFNVQQTVKPSITLDFNGIEAFNLKELQAKLGKGLDKSYDNYIRDLDKDKDGKVTHADFEPRLQPQTEVLTRARFKELANEAILNLEKKDLNNDGLLSKDEFIKPLELPKPQAPLDPRVA